MTPTSLRRIGPYMLRADEDADVIRALDASGSKIGLIRACIRLAMALPQADMPKRPELAYQIGIDAEELALIERARSCK